MNRIITTLMVMIMFTLGSGIGAAASANPVASFSTSLKSGYSPTSVQFNDTITGLPEAWEWNFGDGSPNSNGQSPNNTSGSAGTYIATLNVSDSVSNSTKTQANCITVLNNNDSGSLTLMNTDFSQSSSIPQGVYIESIKNTLSNVTLTYNSNLKCADVTYLKPASGDLFFTNLYPTTDSNITYTLGTEGVSGSSYVNIVASNSLVAVFKKANGDYKLASYWTADNESTQNNYITVPAANIIDNKVTFSVACYESNRTNLLKYNNTIYTKTPFRTMNTRNQNYVFVNQPMVYLSAYFADDDTGPYVVHLYSIKQEIPRKTVTSYGTKSISALAIKYPDPENNGNGINLMKSNGQKSTIYVDADHLDSATVAYQKALLDAGWEIGIHYTVNLDTLPNETAIAIMDSEYNTIVNTFGKQPRTWAARESSGSISQAIYAYQRYGMIWRSCESGASWLSAGNLCNPYWQWWNTSIAQGIVFPAFTVATDKEPVTGSSINASYFTTFSNGFAANNIRLCGLNEYYFTQSAQNTTQVNITDYNNGYMRFTVNTSGYPCTLNVMTNMSNVAVSHDGVTVPYTSEDDGIVFTATNNTTYELRSLLSSSEKSVAILPVANFSTDITEGYAPLTIQFNDFSQNVLSREWDFDNDGKADSGDINPVYIYENSGTYTVNLTVSNENGTNSKTSVINVLTTGSSSGGSSGGSSHSSSDGGEGGSPEPAKNVQVKEISQAFVTNGKPVKFDFTKNATGVMYVSFDAKRTFGKTTTIAEMLKGRSALVSELPSGEVYKSFNVWVGNGGVATSKNIENPTVCFRVEKSWIKGKKIDPASIALNRYSDKKWEQFPVSLSGEDDKFLHFTAKTSGFSSFAITSTSKTSSEETVKEIQLESPETIINKNITANKEQKTAQNEIQGIPGFEIYCGAAGLLTVVLYKRKHSYSTYPNERI
ncbi:PGF-pre-PGF domain-containing protein [Methanosarcina sp.]|uniref:PGF-pre-PGF domain-containing protein n=1 Tax=Methanosarcina sp. TaxID=2213 RepID=UPI003C72E3BA